MSANTLPPWARVKHEPLMMVAGSDFQPGDTLYFSERAYPRILWTKLSESTWAVLVERDGRHERGQISIESQSYYVVKAATPRKAADAPVPGTRIDDFFLNRPLTSIRVEGEHLAVGDVVYLDVNRKRAVILDIGDITFTTFRGSCRRARLQYLDLEKVEPYIFSGFHIAPPFIVVAGPKFAAARQNPALIFWREGVNRWHWKG